jgi:hypothetical protein
MALVWQQVFQFQHSRENFNTLHALQHNNTSPSCPHLQEGCINDDQHDSDADAHAIHGDCVAEDAVPEDGLHPCLAHPDVPELRADEGDVPCTLSLKVNLCLLFGIKHTAPLGASNIPTPATGRRHEQLLAALSTKQ